MTEETPEFEERRRRAHAFLDGETKKPKRKLKAVATVAAPVIPGLLLDDRGKVDPCLHNAAAILRNAWERRDDLRFDRFSGRMLLGAEQLEESTELEVTQWLQRSYCTRFALGTIQHALRSLGFSRSFDALEDHVRSTEWDGVERIHDFSVRYLKTEDTPYAREVGRVMLLSMAARATKPGCKVDTIPVLEGSQGSGKSTAVKILGGPFFGELTAQLGTKEAAEQVEGVWALEIPELQGLSRAEVTAIKSFASLASDRFRRAYARTVTDVPRRCAMVGTTNADAYLRDETGARRFLVLRVGDVDLAGMRLVRDQLIAEAVHRVDAGEEFELRTDLRAAQAEAASERFELDVWADTLASFLVHRPRVTMGECLSHLRIETAVQHAGHTKRVSQVLVTLGFMRRKVATMHGRQWLYVRETTSAVAKSPTTEVGQENEVGQEKANDSNDMSHCPTRPTNLRDSCTRAPAGGLSGDHLPSGTSGTSGTDAPRQDDPFEGLGEAWNE